MTKAKITALGCYTPPRVLTNHDLEQMVQTILVAPPLLVALFVVL